MKRPVLLACGLLFLAPAVGQQTRPAANSMISCANSPLLSELAHEPAKTVLKAYGYDLQAPWKCVKIDSPFTGDSRCFSSVKSHLELTTLRDSLCLRWLETRICGGYPTIKAWWRPVTSKAIPTTSQLSTHCYDQLQKSLPVRLNGLPLGSCT